MSSAYLILTDMHLNVTKENRIDYGSECLSIIDKIYSIAKTYRDEGYNHVYGISIGDLVDKSFPERRKYTKTQQMLKLLLNCFDDFFLCFGNHELTYYKDNPIYSFMKSINNSEIRRLYPQLTCESLCNDEIKTPNNLIFNNSEIVFQGYGTSNVFTTDKEIKILLMHEFLLSDNGLRKFNQLSNVNITPYDINDNKISHIFCGHAHVVIEDWSIGTTKIHNLGSLLRTKHNEIFDYDRTRYIPALIVDSNNDITEIQYNNFKLHKRNIILNEDSIITQNEGKSEIIERKELQNISKMPDLNVDDPLEVTQKIIYDQLDINARNVFEDLKKGIIPIWRR